MNYDVLKFQAKIIGYQFIFLGIICILSLLIVDEPMPYILGAIFGGLIGALTFRLMGVSFEKITKMSPEAAKISGAIHYFLRYIIYGIVLFIAVKADYINILTTFLGLVAIKIVIIFLNFFKIKF